MWLALLLLLAPLADDAAPHVQLTHVMEALARPAPCDGALVARLADLELERAHLLVRYKPAHPKVVELDRRRALLVEAIANAPASAHQHEDLIAYADEVSRRLLSARMDDAKLATVYGDRHPKRLELQRSITDLERVLALLPRAPVHTGALTVRRAEIAATLAYLTASNPEPTPRVDPLRAELAELDRVLAATPASCTEARAALDDAVQRGPSSHPSAEEGAAVFDAIVIARATLVCVAPGGSKPGNSR